MEAVELTPKEKAVLDLLEEALFIPKGYYPDPALQAASLKVAIRQAIKIINHEQERADAYHDAQLKGE